MNNLLETLSSHCPISQLKINSIPKIYTYVTYVHNQDQTNEKVDTRVIKRIFIDYSNIKK